MNNSVHTMLKFLRLLLVNTTATAAGFTGDCFVHQFVNFRFGFVTSTDTSSV